MFKSILRTLPSLSGNFKLNCNITKLDKINNDIYNGYVTEANMIPLKPSAITTGIKLALLNDTYEFDVAKYFYNYNDTFYNDNFNFNKDDYQILDKHNDAMPRNKYFEFGCNRNFIKQSGYQFCFYAPIYCDDYKSLPEFFEIKLDFGYNIIKKIKVAVKDESNKNYLRVYLKKYLDKIDNNVIYMLPKSNQAVYYGINVQTGGLVLHTDDIIANAYKRYNTINNFDNLVCKGFERNKMIMKQIIPLSFSFNIEDILTPIELKYHKNSSVKITGNYVHNNMYNEFYDFRIDYTDLKYKRLNYNPDTMEFKYTISENTLDKTGLCFDEKRYIKYKYSNKLSPNYATWKLKYSSDENPYYTNLNYAFSDNKNNMYKYGEYPIMNIHSIPAVESINDNLIMPFGKYFNKFEDKFYYDEKTSKPTANLIKYINSINNNINTWYYYITDFNNNNSWREVENNKVYYNGVLYDLNNVFDNNEEKLNIDKFAIFVKPNINYISNTEKSSLKTCKNLITISSNESNVNVEVREKTVIKYPEYYFDIIVPGSIYNINNNSYNANVDNNYIMKEDIRYGNYIEIEDYRNKNKYIDYDEYVNKVKNKIDVSILENIKISSFNILPIYNNSNLIKVVNDKKVFILSDELDNLNGAAIPDNIYYSYKNTEKIPVNEVTVNTLNNILNNDHNMYNIQLYEKRNFVSIHDLMITINNITDINVGDKILLLLLLSLIDNDDNFKKYNYIVINKSNSGDKEKYFIEDTTIKEYVYVDTYNFNKILPNKKFNVVKKYGKFLNVDHIKEYITNMHEKTWYSEYVEHIFVRERKYILKDGRISLTDVFTKISDMSNIFNDTLFDDFIKKLSKSTNTFIYNGKSYDLYFYGEFALFDEYLYKYMINDNDFFRALYLYKLNNDYNTITEGFESTSKKSEDIFDSSLAPIFLSIYKDTSSDNHIMSLFNNGTIIKNNNNTYLYLSEVNNGYISFTEEDAAIYFDIDELKNKEGFKQFLVDSKLISEDDLSNHKYENLILNDELINLVIKYFEDDVSLDTLITKFIHVFTYPKNDIDYETRELLYMYFSNYPNMNVKKLYTADKNINIILNKDDNADLYINNLNIVKDGESYKAYYIINVNINNSNNSFNIDNYYFENIIYYNYINGQDFKSYGENNFKFIQPFLTTDIFNEFKQNISTIINMTNIKYNICHVIKTIDTGNSENSYLYENIFYDKKDEDKKYDKNDKDKNKNENKNVNDIVLKNVNKTLQINRYLDNIIPYLYKVNNGILYNVFQLYYKNIYKSINENNIYKSDINIYSYPKLKTCISYDTINHVGQFENYSEVEYKHYNDNNLYMLEKEILINIDKKFTYDELLNFEKTENIIHEFKKYLKKSKKSIYNDNEILFLFNKYDLQCLSEACGVNNLFNKKLYKLKLRFTLK